MKSPPLWTFVKFLAEMVLRTSFSTSFLGEDQEVRRSQMRCLVDDLLDLVSNEVVQLCLFIAHILFLRVGVGRIVCSCTVQDWGCQILKK